MSAAPVLSVLLGLGLLAPAGGTPTPSPTPTVTMVPAQGTPVTFPVEDISGPVEDLVFAEASTDGAVTDTGGTQFRLAADVLFAFDKAELNARARAELAGIARKLKTAGATRLAVVGFTDDKGSDGYNRGLSQRRAAAVEKALASALGSGVRISATGRGEQEPIASNDTTAGRALNRRVTITVQH